MPPVKFTEVVTFSSEDPNNPAENLLKPETYRKWKCGSIEKQASVTLKIEKMVKIRSIDLANDGSAFVEVLVGREGSGEFQVLLVASSFMTPIESRNNENTNRVRMFGPEKLNKNIAEQKWDRVKVVCTQPFNKNVQYGLSFITINAAEETSSTPEIKLGKFSLKEEDSGDPISVGSWFARRKENPSSSASGAAAIRAASASITSSSPAAPTSLKRKAETTNAPDVGFYQLKKKERPASPSLPSSNRDLEQKQRQKEKRPASPALPPSNKGLEQKQRQQESNLHMKKEKKKYNEDEEQSARDNSKQERYADKGNKEDKKRKTENDYDSKNVKNIARDDSKNNQKSNKDERKPIINKDDSERGKKNIKSLPFRSLMKNVEFVMSGYQNPRRSQLRDKLLEMGAKYKPDWDDTCSHLICAFSNTPKYVQVKGKGKIVSHRWIEDCHSKKIRYPWRRYQLVQDDEPESEEEILSEELVPKASTSSYTEPEGADLYGGDTDTDNENTDDEIERALETQKKESAKTSPVETIKIKQEVESSSNGNGNSNAIAKRMGDLEEKPVKINDHKIKEELQIKEEFQIKEEVKIKEEVRIKKVRTKEMKMSSNDDEYDAETDVDEENTNCLKRVDTSSINLPTLGNYLSGKNLMLYGKIENQKRRMLQRYITAFDGTIHEYMSEDVQFVITEDEWDDNFDNALNDNPSLQFVKPTWIWRCSDRQKFVPYQPFMVVPRE